MKRFELYSLALFLALPLSVMAGQAPWYKWQSVTGAIVCAQVSPGSAWGKLDKTYVDSHCQMQDKSTDSAKTKKKR